MEKVVSQHLLKKGVVLKRILPFLKKSYDYRKFLKAVSSLTKVNPVSHDVSECKGGSRR